VMTGSHIDTQPLGGWLDGAYGVMAGLEVLRALDDAKIKTLHPIEVAIWTNEEGSRFTPGAMGSSAFSSPERLAEYLEARDKTGASFSEARDAALTDLDFVTRRPLGQAVASYIEAHIEQGPILETSDSHLGIVTGIQGVRWFTFAVTGAAAHAGTTPLSCRADAMAAAINAAHAVLGYLPGLFDDRLRFTIGRWTAYPNSVNTVAGNVTFTIDLRHPEEEVLEKAEACLRKMLCEPVGRCSTELVRTFCSAPVSFPVEMVEKLAQACSETGAKCIRIVSGAFHDAMFIAAKYPTAMLFVPSRGGVSHSPLEDTAFEDLHLGTQALARAIIDFAGPAELTT